MRRHLVHGHQQRLILLRACQLLLAQQGCRDRERGLRGIRVRRERTVHKHAHLLDLHAGAGLQVALDLLLQGGNRQRHADVGLQGDVHVHAHALLVAGQRGGDDLDLRMLAQAALHQRLQRLDGDADHAVLVALHGEIARALLPGRQGHMNQAERKDRQHHSGGDQRDLHLEGHIGNTAQQQNNRVNGDHAQHQRHGSCRAAQRNQRAEQYPETVSHGMLHRVFLLVFSPRLSGAQLTPARPARPRPAPPASPPAPP